MDDLLLITVKTAKNHPVFANGRFARDAIQCMYRVQCFNPFTIYAFVVMPDHVHFLLSANDLGSIVKSIHRWKKAVELEIEKEHLWQHRFDLQMVSPSIRIIERLHTNPVRRGLCDHPSEYAWSSASCRWMVAELPKHDESPLLSQVSKFTTNFPTLQRVLPERGEG